MYELYRGAERNVVLKRLLPGVRYTFRVKAINGIGESPFSPAATYSTQASVPATPLEPSITSSGVDSVVLRWLPVAGNGSEVSGFQVEMDDGLGGEFSFVGHTHEPQFSVAGLRSGLAYRFRVRAENSEGRSAWSPVCVARTAATAPPALTPPSKVSCTHSSIDIAWQPPESDGGSPVLNYEVELQPKCAAAKRDMPDEWLLVYQGPETSCTLGALRAGCSYRVRVRALNKQGAGTYSIPTDVATSPAIPEAPGRPSISSRTQDSLTVRWDAPLHDGGTPVAGYRLEWQRVGEMESRSDTSSGPSREDSSYQVMYQGVERQAEVTGLEPGTRYQFRVAASNKEGSSPWSIAGE